MLLAMSWQECDQMCAGSCSNGAGRTRNCAGHAPGCHARVHLARLSETSAYKCRLAGETLPATLTTPQACWTTAHVLVHPMSGRRTSQKSIACLPMLACHFVSVQALSANLGFEGFLAQKIGKAASLGVRMDLEVDFSSLLILGSASSSLNAGSKAACNHLYRSV